MSLRFFFDGALDTGLVDLTGSEAHHLTSVCRLQAGDSVILFNGDGHDYPALVVNVHKRHVALEVLRRETICREPPIPVHIAASLPKGDRGQFLIEKLTELGVASFTPLVCRRSVVSVSDSKRDKLQRYVVEASKQCGRNVLMAIHPAMSWSDLVARPGPAVRAVAHPRSRADVAQASVSSLIATGAPMEFAVGPEGGLTDDEVTRARDHGWAFVDLGPRILRIETAAILLASATLLHSPAETPLS